MRSGGLVVARIGPGGARAERGTSMLEAAMATFLFFLLIFAVLEGGTLLGDYLGVSNTVRAAARTASASGDDPLTDYRVLQTVKKEVSALKSKSFNFLVVYKASDPGAEPTPGCKAGTSSAGVCNVYVRADLSRPESDFRCKTAGVLDSPWCPTSRKVAQTVATGGPPDYLGIYLSVDHQMLSNVFGNNRTITEHTVIRLEPTKL
jgi:hypothetical protein